MSLSELRHDLRCKELELAILDVARRRALVEEVPREPLEVPVAVAADQLLEMALHLVDGPADLVALVDHALGRGLVALEEERPAVRVVLGVAEDLEEAEAPEVLLVVVARRGGGERERLVVG